MPKKEYYGISGMRLPPLKCKKRYIFGKNARKHDIKVKKLADENEMDLLNKWLDRNLIISIS